MIIRAMDAKAGDVLEPDGAIVTQAKRDGASIALTLKQPKKKRETWLTPPHWPLMKRTGASA